MSQELKSSKSKKRDALKRNAEMAEQQNIEISSQIYQKGDKYYCAECHTELPLHAACPGCHIHIDWDRIKSEIG